MMKIKWENLHNWWLTKYFFAPLYVGEIITDAEADGRENDSFLFTLDNEVILNDTWENLTLLLVNGVFRM